MLLFLSQTAVWIWRTYLRFKPQSSTRRFMFYKMAASSGISSQTWCGCIQFAYLFKCTSVWWLFALMNIREVWGDSLVLSWASASCGVSSVTFQIQKRLSLFCCSHQTKIALCQNHSHSTYICSDWLCDRYPISKVINCLTCLSNNTCWFQVWNKKICLF